MQTLWNMNPICSGSEEGDTQGTPNVGGGVPRGVPNTLTPPPSQNVPSGYVTGGHVLRLFHGHMDECLTPTAPEQGEERRWGPPNLGGGGWDTRGGGGPQLSDPLLVTPQQRCQLRGRGRVHPRQVPVAPGAPAHQVRGTRGDSGVSPPPRDTGDTGWGPPV